MVRFAPPSKPVTLAPATEQCQIKSELIQFSLRGLDKVRGEWHLVCLALNIRRLAAMAA